MSQPPVSGSGAGAEPGPDSGLPGGSPGRDPRLAAFARGGSWDTCPPGPELTAAAAGVSGPGRRCAGATDDELMGLLGRWAAVESWAAASKLGVVREFLRRRAIPAPGTAATGGLPELWEDGVDHEVAGALRISPQAAGTLVNLAWVLEARLPGIGAKLTDGTIDLAKAKLIVNELIVLDDEHIAAAEKMVLDELAGKTPGQLVKLAALAVATVDPEGTRKRREHAEREEARVRFWRENTGACALAAHGLPADAALAANANINQRALEYKDARIYPDARMDQLRALAFSDILNGVTAAGRIAQAQAEAGAQGQADADRETMPSGGEPHGTDANGSGTDAEPDDSGPDSGGGPGEPGGGPGEPGGGPGGPGGGPGGPGGGPGDSRPGGPAQPDDPAGHSPRPGRPARRGARTRPARPRAVP
jgi:hypothetical protein